MRIGGGEVRIRYHLIILIAIILFALFLRVYKLDQIPHGFFCDEAASGYNTYSILKTGRDYYGNFLPVMAYHLGVYVGSLGLYLMAPSIYLFDLSIFSTRLPLAVIGVLTILTTYLFTKELFNEDVGLLSAFLLSVSPWHLQFSRMAFGAVLVPFFTTLGLFFFLKALKEPKFFVPCGLVFGLSVHTYDVTKLTVPLILIMISLVYCRRVNTLLKTNNEAPKYLFVSSLIFLALVLPIYYLSFFGGVGVRFNQVSIFVTSYPPAFLFILNVLSHLSPDFLFFNGDANLRHSIPGFGQSLLAVMPFILLALYFFAYRRNSREGLVLASLFMIGVTAASLTYESIPHALRSITAVPSLEITAAFGIYVFYQYVSGRDRYSRLALTAIAVLLLTGNIVLFLDAYFTEYPQVSEDWFDFGMDEAINYAARQLSNYDHVVLSSNIGSGDIFVAFFAKIDPTEFHNSRMGKYVTCPYYDIEVCYMAEGHNLFIVKPWELPNGRVRKVVYNSKNQAVLKIVE